MQDASTPLGDSDTQRNGRTLDGHAVNIAWNEALETLQSELDPQIFSAYLASLQLDEFRLQSGAGEQKSLDVIAPSRFICSQVEKGFLPRIEELLSQRGFSDVKVALRVTPQSAPLQSPAPSQRYVVVKKTAIGETPEKAPTPSHAEDPHINSRYLFDSFVVGNSNQFCHAAAIRVAERPGQSYNPLFIYGGVGLGKTHLLHSIGNEVLRRHPNKKVLYLSAEAFTNDLILSLRHARMEEFKRKFRTIEVLLIDDIQFISGKERTQEEFFHTFNALYGAKHQIVLTSDRIPSDIPGIEDRLQTRFCWGLTADLQAPDFETRVAILNRKAGEDGFFVPEDVSHYIAEQISSNVRELEGALTRLHAVCSLKKIPITLESTKVALAPLLTTKTVTVSIEDIKLAVSTHFQIKVSDMVSKRRTKNLSFPRHIAMYLCRKHTTASYPEIGSQFGGRDHSSVIHAANVVSTKHSSDTQVRELVETLERSLFDR